MSLKTLATVPSGGPSNSDKGGKFERMARRTLWTGMPLVLIASGNQDTLWRIQQGKRV